MTASAHTRELLARLGYLDADNFISAHQIDRATEHAHIFRRAVSALHLEGVYVLRPPTAESSASTPLVYVASAESAEHADHIHRHVWNQNIVPFVLVQTPLDGTRLYAGFRYRRTEEHARPPNLLNVAESLDQVLDKLESLHARSIEDGSIWQAQRDVIQPKQRVDWRLLRNLKTVAKRLTTADGLDRRIAHALIGKFVFLRYLRDRDILTDGRFAAWGLDVADVLGRHCALDAFKHLLERLEAWLNGSVFPLPLDGPDAVSESHLRYVAGVFSGDDAASGQMHLDFRAYDFSFIPIETLSVIYEQFLNIEGRQRSLGAYYTPIPLVNFTLSELDDHVPLAHGRRILDPSCGSGAFLVQCYRRIIERERATRGKNVLTPERLKTLLTTNIFGVDRDIDACRVSELSLLLTLLDYVKPPDLMQHPDFKLPVLAKKNIFEADFFDAASSFETSDASDEPFDVVVGNPPWLELSPKRPEDSPARTWVANNSKTRSVTKMQLAEAFAWKCLDHLAREGICGLILPAMSLYKAPKSFRRAFFSRVHTHTVCDFANLREVLFGGRGRQPAITMLYGHGEALDDPCRPIDVFSPLVINQEANRPRPGSRLDTWNITLNASEVSFLERTRAAKGDAIAWKVASWGTRRDGLLLEALRRRFSSIGDIAEELGLVISQGPHLRSSAAAREKLTPAPEFAGQLLLNTKRLTRYGRVFSVPGAAREPIPPELDSVRVGRKNLPLAACRPPHVIVSAGRTTALFSDEFLVPAARQVGIGGPPQHRDHLIALTLFLNSEFLEYCEFFTSAQTGVLGSLATVASLRGVPCPITLLEPDELKRWVDLHERLVANSRARLEEPIPDESGFFGMGLDPSLDNEFNGLMAELNETVNTALGLSVPERWLVHGLVHIGKETGEGKVSDRVTRAPSSEELSHYCETLQGELDGFLRREAHVVHASCGDYAGLVAIGLAEKVPAEMPSPAQLDRTFGRLHRQSGQWLYFDRNLLVFENGWSYFLKPAQRYWWTRRRALLDADRLIAESIGRA